MPAPPYSVGTQSPSRSSEAISVQDARIEAMLAIQVPDARRHRAGAPFAYGLLQQPVLFGKLEVEHA